MTLLYPQLLWLFIPFGVFWYRLRPHTLTQRVHLIILALILLALARPVIPHGLQEEKIDAREIIIALDLSYSMRADDIAPDRYRFAKATIDALLDLDTKDNIMLIGFTTNPLLLSPPTTDHALVKTALDALDRDNILTKGTSLTHLFNMIAKMPKRKRQLLLITDGGEEQRLSPLVDALAQTPLHLSILAMGTQKGSTIPKPDGSRLRDKEDRLVISRINPLLARLAEAVGGNYLTPQSTPQATAKALMAQLDDTHQPTTMLNKKRYTYTELYPLPLLVAVLLFLMLHTKASVYLVMLSALLGMQVQASPLDLLRLSEGYRAYRAGDYNTSLKLFQNVTEDSLQKRYALASACYKQGAYQKALLLYRSIHTTSPSLKQKLYYNIANTYAQLKSYDKARIYYTKALQLGEDADARYNLARVLFLKAKAQSRLKTLPKPQNANGSAAKAEEGTAQKEHNDDAQQGSGAGSGGESKLHIKEKAKKRTLLKDDGSKPKQPLGSKVYELINKGYIRETKPW